MAMLAEPRRKCKLVLNPIPRPLWKSDACGDFGKKMLERMGWSAGKGLGSQEQGIQEPLRATYKSSNSGVGYKGDGNPFHNQDEFNALLSSLGNEIVTDGEQTAHTFESLEEKSKNCKTRVHYKKFTRGKDISRYSGSDLACILGTGKKIEEQQVNEEEDDINKEENTFGVTTINSGSIDDYFRSKSLKKTISNVPPSDNLFGCETSSSITQKATKIKLPSHHTVLGETNCNLDESCDFTDKGSVVVKESKMSDDFENKNNDEGNVSSDYSLFKKKKRKTKPEKDECVIENFDNSEVDTVESFISNKSKKKKAIIVEMATSDVNEESKSKNKIKRNVDESLTVNESVRAAFYPSDDKVIEPFEKKKAKSKKSEVTADRAITSLTNEDGAVLSDVVSTKESYLANTSSSKKKKRRRDDDDDNKSCPETKHSGTKYRKKSSKNIINESLSSSVEIVLPTDAGEVTLLEDRSDATPDGRLQKKEKRIKGNEICGEQDADSNIDSKGKQSKKRRRENPSDHPRTHESAETHIQVEKNSKPYPESCNVDAINSSEEKLKKKKKKKKKKRELEIVDSKPIMDSADTKLSIGDSPKTLKKFSDVDQTDIVLEVLTKEADVHTDEHDAEMSSKSKHKRGEYKGIKIRKVAKKFPGSSLKNLSGYGCR